MRQKLCLICHCTKHKAQSLVPIDLQSGRVKLNELHGPILRIPLSISCIPPILSHSRKEMYTSASPMTINFEIMAQRLTTHRLCDIISDYKVPSTNWFVRKSTCNAWHTPKGSQGLPREGQQHRTHVRKSLLLALVGQDDILARKQSWLWIWICPWWSCSQMAKLNAAFIALRHFRSS